MTLAAQLGFGVHGIVHVVEDKIKKDRSAIKVHHSTASYERERAAYERLKEEGVSIVLGFNVPQLIRIDNELRVIEMTIVTRPFVLDFAGAYLDSLPEFPAEVWAEWESEKRDQFGARWSKVEAVIESLEAIGIYLTDVTPNNVAFVD